MPVLTSPATYKEGIIKPLIRPDFDVAETIVTFIPAAAKGKDQNGELSKSEVLERTFGIMPDLPAGTTYTDKIRKSWERRLKHLWQ